MSTFAEIIGSTPEEVRELIETKDEHYLSYTIRKASGKHRWIDAPQGRLKEIQYNILKKILYRFSPHRAAVGFVSGISVADGAKRHLENNVVLCMDMKDFFNSIKYERALRVSLHLLNRLHHRLDSKYELGAEESDARNLAKLLTFKGQVPQGAPTSPALANLTAYVLDMKLEEFAMKHGLVYTRYADDLAFSHADVKFDLYERIPEISGIIKEQDFTINAKKTRVMKPHKRMSITGVVINEKLGVPKYKWRNLRAQLHQLQQQGQPLTQLAYQQIRGQVEWIRSLNPTRGHQLLQSLGKIPLAAS